MQRATEQEKRMTRYLLGDLPEPEQVAVEQEYFADPEKLEEVWAAENDLVDRYARGRLSRGERKLFERNYLQSPKLGDGLAVARKLLEIADRRDAGAGVAPIRWMETLNALRTPRFIAPATAFLLLFLALSWLMIERARLNSEIGRTKTQLSDQQRRQQEIEDQLAAERAQGGKLKSELDRALETLAKKQSHTIQSILSFLLTRKQSPRGNGGNQQQLTIPSETKLVRLRMKVEKDDSRIFQATIRA